MHGSNPARTMRKNGAALLHMVFFFAAVAFARPQGRPANDTARQEIPSTLAVAPSANDRQKAMQADMDRLLQLARQLKAEVGSSRKDELSVKVVRDADEIDKLARSARGRIR